jgi:hypothetical protein
VGEGKYLARRSASRGRVLEKGEDQEEARSLCVKGEDLPAGCIRNAKAEDREVGCWIGRAEDLVEENRLLSWALCLLLQSTRAGPVVSCQVEMMDLLFSSYFQNTCRVSKWRSIVVDMRGYSIPLMCRIAPHFAFGLCKRCSVTFGLVDAKRGA